MNSLGLMLLVSFIESFATICVERGIYFFSSDRLHFSEVLNLSLALAFGLAYMSGALLSHRLAHWLKEKPVLVATLWAQVLAHLGLALLWHRPDFIFTGNIVLGLVNGLKWPVIESYVSAGRAPAATARAVGGFNIAWAAAVPLALIAAGPMIASSSPQLLFVVPAVINVASLLLIARLRPSPIHLALDHPQRPDEAMMRRLRSLLSGSRWLLSCSYGTMFILAAVMPLIFTRRLATSVQWSAGLSGLLDVVRLGAFVVLQFYSGWHYRLRYLLLAMAFLPVGFFMVLCGGSLGAVLVGEIVFGLVGGLLYYSALYYAMVVHSAAVEAGGEHEGLIGASFAAGPAAGLLGMALQGVLGKGQLGLLLGVGAIFAVCFPFAARHLARARAAAPRTVNHMAAP
jgi:MFS family permease